MATILFDIDGTLINTLGAGGSALREAFRHTLNIDELGKVAFSGRTDRGIISNLLRLHQIEWADEVWEELCACYLELLPKHLQTLKGSVLPGVHELLAGLRDNGAAIGLLTGNLRAGAEAKLAHYQLQDFFAFGGYGDDHEDRDDVARAALAAAREAQAAESVWVIGDTPLDIRCARAIGARVIAVGTGMHETSDLAKLQPDLLFEDLSQHDVALKALLS